MRNKITIMLLAMTTFLCCAQSFLSKYPELTKRNLSAFFVDWKAYSDSVAHTVVSNDSLISEIVDSQYLTMKPDTITLRSGKKISEQYVVAPQDIKVFRYDTDYDFEANKFLLEVFWSFDIPASQANRIDSVTPRLPDCGLYITPDISRVLSLFAGGVRLDDNTISKTNHSNVDELRKYIPVNYGHWGGYWWFTTFPMITKIDYANNLIVVYRRTTWCNGDEIWYIKEDGQFLPDPEPRNGWIE